MAGDSLSVIGTKLGIDWHRIAAANGLEHPFPIFVGQVLKVPGAVVLARTIDILNPIDADEDAVATSSSNQAHHRPYGGDVSCDIALPGSGTNPGKPARFFVNAPPGVRVQGVVFSVGPACRSGSVDDGGNAVKVMLQHAIGGGQFQDTGAWVLYAHLDPVLVSVDQVLAPEALIGNLGAPHGREYSSSCAEGSHIHVEATNGSFVVDEKASFRRSTVVRIGF